MALFFAFLAKKTQPHSTLARQFYFISRLTPWFSVIIYSDQWERGRSLENVNELKQRTNLCLNVTVGLSRTSETSLIINHVCYFLIMPLWVYEVMSKCKTQFMYLLIQDCFQTVRSFRIHK